MKLYLNSTKADSQKTWNKTDYLLAAAKRLEIDYILPYKPGINSENVLNIEPYSNFIKGSKWTGVWEIDLLLDRAQMSTGDWTAADDVFIAVGTIPKRMFIFKDKVTLLFQACDPFLHKRIPSISQDWDFVFSGSVDLKFYKERKSAMSLLRKNGFTFADFPKDKAPEEYVRNINKAKVQFIRSMKTPIGDGELAQRFFECLAIGPVLTNYVEDLKLTGLVEGVDYLSYKDDKEMLLKMHKLIDNEDYRQEVAQSGRNKALLMHSYEHRLMSIINFIKEKNGM